MKKTLLTLSAALLWGASAVAQIASVKQVNNTTYPLIDSIVNKLAGAGVIISNVKTNLGSSGTSFTSNALGSFKASDGLIGKTGASIREGALLTTGMVGGVIGTSSINSSTSSGLSNNGNNNGLNGNTLLNAILPASSSSNLNDVVVVQFDFIPVFDSIAFNYVFASEEYNNFVGSSFNDVFGLFIKGPGIQTQAGLPTNTRNIAVLPSTISSSNVVSINNVNAGNGTTNPAVNPSYYINNYSLEPTYISSPVDNNRSNFFRYDGLTRRLIAKTSVIPCQTYTLTFAIADVGDGAYDSGVFIENGSLQSFGDLPIPKSPIIHVQPLNCNQMTLSVADADTAYSNLVWSNGQIGTSITVSSAGTYSVVRNYQRCTNVPVIPFPSVPVQVTMPSAPNAVVSVMGNVLSVLADSSATYQWFKNGELIQGATQSTYTATATGVYSVQISRFGCVVMSNGKLVEVVGLQGKDIGHLVKVYPNPVTGGTFAIDLDNLHEAKLTITNELGQVVKQQNISQSHTVLGLKQGIYFLKIQSDEGMSVQRLVVE